MSRSTAYQTALKHLAQWAKLRPFEGGAESASKRAQFLQDVQHVYKYPFFSSKELSDFVLQHYSCFAGKDKEGTVGVRLPSVVASRNDRVEDIVTSLVFRQPVYYGYTVHSAFSDKRLRDTLGYTAEECMAAVNPAVRFAIVGPVCVMGRGGSHRCTQHGCTARGTNTERKESSSTTSKNGNNAGLAPHFIHTWGCNLETSQTQDFQRMVGRDGELDLKAYHSEFVKILRLIMTATAYQDAHTQPASAPRRYVRMPLIGLGQFLSALGRRERGKAVECFWAALETVLTETREVILAARNENSQSSDESPFDDGGKSPEDDSDAKSDDGKSSSAGSGAGVTSQSTSPITISVCLYDPTGIADTSFFEEWRERSAVRALLDGQDDAVTLRLPTRQDANMFDLSWEEAHEAQRVDTALQRNTQGHNNSDIPKNAGGIDTDGGESAPAAVYLVNAWDSHSFVGNGGSRDMTVDGFCVAAAGPGRALPNTSFLHNYFMWGDGSTDGWMWIK